MKRWMLAIVALCTLGGTSAIAQVFGMTSTRTKIF